VPLFALANAGIEIDGGFLARAFTSPITLGILFGYVIGKPVGILGSSWLLTRLSRGRLRPPVGWAAVAGGGTIAGIGFTVALLVATLAFEGSQLEEAKLGILSAALGASILTWLLFRWRHLPLNDVHPNTQLAAEAAEAAAHQGAFWEMHDLLLEHQDALRPNELIGYAEQLGLDVECFTNDLREQAGAARVAEDVDSADLSGVSGTPTFFINGRRHYGAYDIATLSAAVRAAGAQAAIAPTSGS